MRRVSESGVPVGVLVSPVIPALTDPELESILEAHVGSDEVMAELDQGVVQFINLKVTSRKTQ